jgi:hypothetical protein
MKKVFLSFFAIACFCFTSSAQEEGAFRFGAGVQLFDISEAVGLQGKAVYGLNETLDIGGAFTYWLEDFIQFSIDANVQYKGLDVSDSFKLQPLAGLTYLKTESIDIGGGFGTIGGSTTSLHIGASFRFVLEGGMTIYADPILILDDGSPINISGGILF